MHRILQTRYGSHGGNCHQACLASILELPLDDIPDFCNDYPATKWDQAENEWLLERGLFCVHLRFDDPEASAVAWLTNNVPCVAGVNSLTTKGAQHSVIYYKGNVIHDPHQSQVHRWRKVKINIISAIVVVNPANKTLQGYDDIAVGDLKDSTRCPFIICGYGTISVCHHPRAENERSPFIECLGARDSTCPLAEKPALIRKG